MKPGEVYDWSDPKIWYTILLYLSITSGILVVLTCLAVFGYELSDQYRAARFVSMNNDYADDWGLWECEHWRSKG